jgi:hypothetical protein
MHRETIGHAIVAAEHGAKVLAKGGLPSVALIGDIKDKNHRDKDFAFFVALNFGVTIAVNQNREDLIPFKFGWGHVSVRAF